MTSIRVVWGTGRGPTEMAAYDAALADANVHNYNLVGVSSVIPADATVEAVGTAPDLGAAGNRLTVVEAHANAAGPQTVSAALGWVTGPGPGLFYEAAGDTDASDMETRVSEGLDAGASLRDWTVAEETIHSESVTAASGEYAAAAVLGVYGESASIW
jgi:arginine decarboxylase